MNFGQAGLNLLNACKNLRSYDHKNVSKLLEENRILETKMKALKDTIDEFNITEEISTNYFLLKRFEDRNKRILRAYLFWRSLRIQESYFTKNNIRYFLSNDEKTHYAKYQILVGEYLNNFKYLDFFSNDPPLELFVHVLTLEDCGVILDENVFIELKKGRLYFVKKKSILHLLNRNMIQLV
ncbi:DNA replication complex GINS protein PSF1 [Astathelohania contejeani]|uniref:DNA replication complex GINS protein PSF1 n=1 Tax=Astathelohania contejeani TaxID=164912 RepID=A0ABQ7HV99_9MICR|nr:DNA replication complex GINS protein PSF1 [Thelohania contejeani]